MISREMLLAEAGVGPLKGGLSVAGCNNKLYRGRKLAQPPVGLAVAYFFIFYSCICGSAELCAAVGGNNWQGVKLRTAEK